MTNASQAQVRSWARAQGMTVNDRGSLPASITQAYALAHSRTTKGTTVTSPARKTSARKTTARKASSRKVAKALPKASPRKAAPRKAAAKASAKGTRPRKAAPSASRRTAVTAARPAVAATVAAPAAGTADLAGGLRAYLGSIDSEVRAVSSLSERIDGLVTELNELRDQQAKRLIVLDTLRASVSDKTLGSFLDQAIKPRKTRVSEVIPERLL